MTKQEKMNNSLDALRKKILSVYAMVAAGSIMMLIPVSLIPLAGFSCAMVGFITAYLYRWRAGDNSLMSEHMTFVIRTVWWASLILLVGMGLFASVLMSNGDLSMIHDLVAQAERGLVPTESDIQMMQAAFVQANKRLIAVAAIICLLPYPLYLVVRMVNGVRRVCKKT